MYQADAILENEAGLHARPASEFISTASKYKSNIIIIKDDREYNAKSILDILSMAACKGTKLTIQGEGTDEKEAVEALKALVDNKFGE